MKQTGRPFPVFLPPVSSLSFSCPFRSLVSVPSTRFVFRVSSHVLSSSLGARPARASVFVFSFRFPRSVLFPFTILGHFSYRSRAPRREGLYPTPTPANTPNMIRVYACIHVTLTHSCSCLLPRSLIVFSYRSRAPRREDPHTFPSLRSHTPSHPSHRESNTSALLQWFRVYLSFTLRLPRPSVRPHPHLRLYPKLLVFG